MRKKITLGTTVAIVILCCLLTFQVTFILLQKRFEAKYLSEAVSSVDMSSNAVTYSIGDGTVSSQGQQYASSDLMRKIYSRLSEVDEIFQSYYIDDLDDETIIDSVLSGYVAGTGDKFGAYYNAESLESFISDLEGELVGIGVNVIYNTDYKVIEVLNVIPDSPALEAGVMPGDLIVYVGEEKESVEALGYYPAINRLRGEIGTHAVFTVFRGEGYTEEVDFDIVRDRVTEVTVLTHIYANDSSIGVIKITEFDGSTPTQFVNAVEELTEKGCDKLIIDLRYNPGGELTAIVSILDYILPEGPIIRIMDKEGNEVKRYSSEPGELNIPMAVVVNGSTASAAELFTSAVRDYNKATIIGTTTYGKGCMQTTIPLASGGAVSVTYRMYNPPFSENYHGIGIVPDIEIELDEALATKNIYKITDEEDNQLAAAAESFHNN